MKPDEYYRRAVVKRWVDGDTVKVWVDLGFGVWQSATLQLAGTRLAILSEAETATARELMEGRAPKGAEVTIQTVRSRKDAAGQSFGRWVANVWNVHGRNMADVLKANGYGVSSD